MRFRKTKAGVTICPFFTWISENIEGQGLCAENDVNLVYCVHQKNKNKYEGNCQEKLCPLLESEKV